MIKSEITIQNEIRIALAPYAHVFRANVGLFYTKDGRQINTGLPKGFSDLFGFRNSDGKMFFFEVKKAKGKSSIHQDNFLKEMSKYDVIAGIVRSVDDAMKLLGIEDGVTNKNRFQSAQNWA